MRLENEVAIVVGGGAGIGKASSIALAKEGAKVMVASRSDDHASHVAAEITAQGYDAIAMQVDMTDEKQVNEMAQVTLDKFGRIDILCNIAGGSSGPSIREKPSPFSMSTTSEWNRIIDINLNGARHCTRAVINHMIERRSGKIISFSSITGVIGAENNADYCAAKAGIIGFTRGLAIEVAKYGINVNCISPGIVGTERMANFPQEILDKLTSGIHLGRMGKPEEIAGVVVFLASDDSNYMTGENIIVAGGKDLDH